MSSLRVTSVLLCLVAACSLGATEPPTDEPSCEGGACDNGPAQVSSECQSRREDAASGRAFRDSAIHWSCEGRNSYCESRLFAEIDDEFVSIEEGSVLTDDQLFWLEDTPAAVVGRCVFSTWLSDASATPGCVDGTNCTVGVSDVYGASRGIPIAEFVSRVPHNKIASLRNLVGSCHARPGDTQRPDAYDEGCTVADSLAKVGDWLSGETSNAHVCAAMSSLWDCGCTEPEDIESTMLSSSFYGPDLALSDGQQLPIGCERINDHMVTCTLEAADVARGPDACLDRYGRHFQARIAVPSDSFSGACPADATASCGVWGT